MTKPFTVGLVGPLPPPSGGMANQTRQLARLLAEEGIAVEVVQVNAPYRPAWMERVRGIRAFFRLLPYLVGLFRAAGRVDVLHVMANSGWAWHLFAAPAIWIGRLRGTPAVVNYRGGAAEAFLARQAAWVRPTMRQAAALIVPSGFLQGVFGRIGVGADIVPNVVDLERFHPASLRTAGHHLIVTRNLEGIYDIPTALRAFVRVCAIHADARLTIAGSGPELTALQALAHELDIARVVRFTGRLDNAAIADLYRDADLLLNPSTVDNTPNSLLEAMASGVPIVTTDVGGIPHLVEHDRTAVMVPPRDPDAMAAAALRVFQDAALASSLREAGIAEAQRYRWTSVRPLLLAAYERAAGRASLRARTT